MVEAEKNKNRTKIEEVAPALDGTEGNALIEKILSALQNSQIPETPIVPEANAVENKEKEYLDRLQRLQAEFENFRKRTEKEKSENLANANANLISQLLKVVDNFELSLKHRQDKGVSMIYAQLNEILAKQGLRVIDTKGAFDPKIHEAIMKVDGEKDGVILEEYEKGYFLNDRLLRASKVQISKITEKK